MLPGEKNTRIFLVLSRLEKYGQKTELNMLLQKRTIIIVTVLFRRRNLHT